MFLKFDFSSKIREKSSNCGARITAEATLVGENQSLSESPLAQSHWPAAMAAVEDPRRYLDAP